MIFSNAINDKVIKKIIFEQEVLTETFKMMQSIHINILKTIIKGKSILGCLPEKNVCQFFIKNVILLHGGQKRH